MEIKFKEKKNIMSKCVRVEEFSLSTEYSNTKIGELSYGKNRCYENTKYGRRHWKLVSIVLT